MANDSINLTASRNKKDDEYYTLFEDIAAELPNYKEQMRGKRIICPCDWDESLDEICVYASEKYIQGNDLFGGGSIRVIDTDKTDTGKVMRDIKSVTCNFIKFLISHAEAYGIKSISVSGYDPASGKGVKFQDVDYSKYDLAITNPPFSEFREMISILFKAKIDFLMIGPQNAITYANTFEHIKNNEMWLGYHHHLTGFKKPDGTVLPKNHNLPRSCCWYTNLDVAYRHDELILVDEYNEDQNPKFVNYDAIETCLDGRSTHIPYDYDGKMGVPITFLQRYNPDQFEIIGSSLALGEPMANFANSGEYMAGGTRFYHTVLKESDRKKGYKYHRCYDRIVIRNKKVTKKDEE